MILDRLKEQFKSPRDAFSYLSFNLNYNKSTIFNPEYRDNLSPEYIDFIDRYENFIIEANKKFEQGEENGLIDLFCKIFEISGDKGHFINKNMDFFNKVYYFSSDINSDPVENLIDLITGYYFSRISKASFDIDNWEQISDIIDKYQIETLPFIEREKKLSNRITKKDIQESLKKYHFKSITVAPFYEIKKHYNEIEKGAEQLAYIIGKNNIGMDKLGFQVGTVKGDFSGFSTQSRDGKEHFIVFKPGLVNRVMGHEWFHAIDFEISKQTYIEAVKEDTDIDLFNIRHLTTMLDEKEELVEQYPELKKLIKSFKELEEDNQKELEKDKEKTVYSISNTLDLFISRYLAEDVETNTLARQIIEEPDKTANIIKENMRVPSKYSDIEHYIGIVLAEAEMFQNYKEEQNEKKETYFYEFAKKASERMVSITKESAWEGYSESNLEMAARSFEYYLITKGGDALTTIGEEGSSFYPKGMDAQRQKIQWEKAIIEIKKALNLYFPEDQNNVESFSVSKRIKELNQNNIKKPRTTLDKAAQ